MPAFLVARCYTRLYPLLLPTARLHAVPHRGCYVRCVALAHRTRAVRLFTLLPVPLNGRGSIGCRSTPLRDRLHCVLSRRLPFCVADFAFAQLHLALRYLDVDVCCVYDAAFDARLRFIIRFGFICRWRYDDCGLRSFCIWVCARLRLHRTTDIRFYTHLGRGYVALRCGVCISLKRSPRTVYRTFGVFRRVLPFYFYARFHLVGAFAIPAFCALFCARYALIYRSRFASRRRLHICLYHYHTFKHCLFVEDVWNVSGARAFTPRFAGRGYRSFASYRYTIWDVCTIVTVVSPVHSDIFTVPVTFSFVTSLRYRRLHTFVRVWPRFSAHSPRIGALIPTLRARLTPVNTFASLRLSGCCDSWFAGIVRTHCLPFVCFFCTYGCAPTFIVPLRLRNGVVHPRTPVLHRSTRSLLFTPRTLFTVLYAFVYTVPSFIHFALVPFCGAFALRCCSLMRLLPAAHMILFTLFSL